jgi:hypothetical protein
MGTLKCCRRRSGNILNQSAQQQKLSSITSWSMGPPHTPNGQHMGATHLPVNVKHTLVNLSPVSGSCTSDYLPPPPADTIANSA